MIVQNYTNTFVTNAKNSLDLSGTYSNKTITNEYLIREAYERLGIAGEDLTGNRIQAALRSMNFILLQWLNLGPRQWTIKAMTFHVVEGISSYSLPPINDILDISVRKQTRLTTIGAFANGTPWCTSGNINCACVFDGNSSTGFNANQNEAVGFVFNPGRAPKVDFIGIRAFTVNNGTPPWRFILKTSNADGTEESTLGAFNPITYPSTTVMWFNISGKIKDKLYIYEETGIEFNIGELYFSKIEQDLLITPISRYDYLALPCKYSTNGRPTQYFFDKQISSYLYIWPYPISDYHDEYILLVNYRGYLQDIGLLANVPEIPCRFYEAMICELVAKLSQKEGAYDPNLSAMAKEAFEVARIDDTEDSTIRITQSLYW